MRLHTLPTVVRTCWMASTVSCRIQLCCHLANMIRRSFGQSLTWPASVIVNKKPRKPQENPAVSRYIKVYLKYPVMNVFVNTLLGRNLIVELIELVWNLANIHSASVSLQTFAGRLKTYLFELT